MIFSSSNVVLVLLEHGSWEGKWEKMLDVNKIKNRFLLESWYSTDMIPGSAKNVHMCTVPQ